MVYGDTYSSIPTIHFLAQNLNKSHYIFKLCRFSRKSLYHYNIYIILRMFTQEFLPQIKFTHKTSKDFNCHDAQIKYTLRKIINLRNNQQKKVLVLQNKIMINLESNIMA